MIAMRLSEAARAMSGELHAAPATAARGFTGVSTDSRKPVRDTLFFALKGERHDGHDHVPAVLAAGAAAAVVARDDAALGEPRIVVDDTQRALGRLAAAHRNTMDARVVAITGNSGKTTTREFVAAVLRRDGATLATQGNFNNEIGLPLTLFGLDATHRYAVLELGQGQPGDIAYLTDIVQPDIAVVTNVTGAHLAGFGTLEAIASGKGEIYAQLKPDGVAIINADDAFAGFWRARLPTCRVLSYSVQEHVMQGPPVDVRAEAIALGVDGCARFTLSLRGTRTPVTLTVPGLHNVSNALAAACVGLACGIAPATIAAALAEVQPVAGRLVVRMLDVDGRPVRLIDDTYNANPGSVKAAVRTLCGYSGRRLLVLGHMAELGPTAASLHREVGAYACAAGVDALFVTGDFAGDTAAGFGSGARTFGEIDLLVGALRADLAANAVHREVTVLVKGSRSARMERVVAALTGEKDAALAH